MSEVGDHLRALVGVIPTFGVDWTSQGPADSPCRSMHVWDLPAPEGSFRCRCGERVVVMRDGSEVSEP